eukprot:TRINITY_DN12456_c0_g1_i1.p1 TRINITY_DN12456_c0_g1~~TRINITY_DN12456_c0_g1_i1.p1  ORF type:complete len:458 (+),score=135.99 TRINITY_DN12456_c0_g1_i1:81-1376(+)
MENANPYSSEANVFLAGNGTESGGGGQANPFDASGGQADPFGEAAVAYSPPQGGSSPAAVQQHSPHQAVDPFARPADGGAVPPPVPAVPPPAAPAPATGHDMAFFEPEGGRSQGSGIRNTSPPPAWAEGGGAQGAGNEDPFAALPPGGTMQSAPGRDSFVSTATAGTAQQRQPAERTSKFWKLAFYQQFFDIDTADVVHRVRCVFTPWIPPAYLCRHGISYSSLGEQGQGGAGVAGYEGLNGGPDIYGPLWVTTTLWVALAVFGHIASKFAWQASVVYTPQESDTPEALPAHVSKEGQWDYSFAWALVGAAVIYSYSVGVPLLLYFAMRCWNCPVGFFDTLCLYGYSMSSFVAAAVLCVIPVGALQWLFVAAAGLISGASIVLNLYGAWRRNLAGNTFLFVLGGVCVVHLGLTLFMKLFCFNWDGSDPADV